MKFPTLVTGLVALTLAAPAVAGGDPAKGEKEFGKCKSCHTVEAPDGTTILKGGKTGPNLYGVIGSPAAATGFKYGAGLKAAAEKGLVWDEANFAEYVVDPGAFLKAYTGDAAAKSSMTFKLKKGGADIAAWLASVGPAN